MSSLRELKNIGHQLLDEYIALKNNYRKDKTERKKAYEKLEKKLKMHHNSHFSMMHTEEEVLHANAKLREMIQKRRNKIENLGWDKVVVAPNVRELQKQANELNKNL